MDKSPKCLSCKYLVSAEIGYSESTVTGDIFKCSMGKFPDWEYSTESDSEMAKLKECGDKCGEFKEGPVTKHIISCNINREDNCSCEWYT